MTELLKNKLIDYRLFSKIQFFPAVVLFQRLCTSGNFCLTVVVKVLVKLKNETICNTITEVCSESMEPRRDWYCPESKGK